MDSGGSHFILTCIYNYFHALLDVENVNMNVSLAVMVEIYRKLHIVPGINYSFVVTSFERKFCNIFNVFLTFGDIKYNINVEI